MFGDSFAFYEFNIPVSVNQFSALSFDIRLVDKSEQLLVCVFEEKDNIPNLNLIGTEFRCVDVTESGKVEIKTGDFFDDRLTDIKYFSVTQVNKLDPKYGESKIANITIELGEESDIFDSNGRCRDANALKIERDTIENIQYQECVCKDFFVASNGGTVLKAFDSCVPCLSCGFDGESCKHDRDCMTGICDGHLCIPGGVSKTMLTMLHFKASVPFIISIVLNLSFSGFCTYHGRSRRIQQNAKFHSRQKQIGAQQEIFFQSATKFRWIR